MTEEQFTHAVGKWNALSSKLLTVCLSNLRTDMPQSTKDEIDALVSQLERLSLTFEPIDKTVQIPMAN